MNLFVFFVIFGSSAISLSQLHDDNISGLQITLTNGRVEVHFDEFSGGNLLDIDTEEDVPEKLKSMVKIKRNEFLVELDVDFPWNENLRVENSKEMITLKESFEKYLVDLLAKLKLKNMKVKIRELKITQIGDFCHFKLIAECLQESKQMHEKNLQCQTIEKIFSKEFNVKELLIYFHEIGYSEQVNPSTIMMKTFASCLNNFIFI